MKNKIHSIIFDSLYFGGILIIIVASSLLAQERVGLTVPEAKPSNTGYIVERLTLDYVAATIVIQLRGDNGEAVSCAYGPATNPTAQTLLVALNKANLSTAYAGNAATGSLKQRIFHRLVIMNEAPVVCGVSLAGSVAGTVP